MSIIFADGEEYESYTNFMLSIPVPKAEGEPSLSQRLISESLLPVQPTKSEQTTAAILGNQDMLEAAGVDRRPLLERAQDIDPTLPLNVLGVGRTVAPRVAATAAAERVPGPIESRGVDVYNTLLARGEPAATVPGTISRTGGNTFNRELGRDPISGQFGRRPSDMGGTGPTWEETGSAQVQNLRAGRTSEFEQVPYGFTTEEWRNFTPRQRRQIRNSEQEYIPVSTQQALDDLERAASRISVPSPVQRPAEALARSNEARALSAVKSGPTQEIPFTSKDGKQGVLAVHPTNEGKNVYVSWIGDPLGKIGGKNNPVTMGPGDMGAKEIRRLLGEVANRFPDAETISGWRITGARTNAGTGSLDAVMKIPRKKVKANN